LAVTALACIVLILVFEFAGGGERVVILTFAAVAVAFWGLWLILRKYPRVEINHIPLFTFGFLFYWILPLLIRPEGGYFSPVSDSTVIAALCIMAGIYICFIIGDRMGCRLRYESCGSAPLRGCRPFLYVVLAAALIYVVAERGALFVEYTDNPARGTLTSFALLLFAIAISRAASRNESSIKNRYFSAFFLSCIFLAYLGQRMSLVSACVSLAVYWSCYFGGISTRRLAIGFVAAVFLVGFIGLIRMGDEVSLAGLGTNVLTEPLGVAISLFDFLSSHHLPLLAAPTELLSRFSNLLPSAIVGNKQDLVVAWRGDISSPFGSFNAFVSWMLNFGILGSFAFAALVGFCFRWLRQKGTALSRSIYPMLCGFLAFSFFRDDFGIVIVKEMLEASIIFPVLVFGFSSLVFLPHSERSPRAAGVLPGGSIPREATR